jgi:glycosyltransferase involved in cell wall biosynthesis
MQMSPHTVRWIGQIADRGWDLHIFPVNYLPVHYQLRGVTVHQPWYTVRPRLLLRTLLANPGKLLQSWGNLEAELHPHKLPVRAIYPLPVLASLAPKLNGVRRVRLGDSECTAPLAYGPHVLARLIRKLKPDLIHSMEFQHCGYNVLRAKEIIGNGFPAWLATNWGSDIYYYRRFEDHRRQIGRLLRNIDYYSCECRRDLGLAMGMGFSGMAMPVMPNSGGMDLHIVGELRRIHRTSERRLVMVKGYQHFAGRAFTALEAVERCAKELKNYKVVVFSPSPEVYPRVDELRAYTDLDITILPYSEHETILRMYSRARVYLGVSVSDAISTSMLEAIALGTFPIQTNTSCCDEWLEDGVTGFSIPHDDVSVIADRLKRALSDDALVDRAAELNWSTACARLDQEKLKKQAIAFYDMLFADLERRRAPIGSALTAPDYLAIPDDEPLDVRKVANQD